MRAITYQHEPNEGLGLLESALKTEGFTLVKRFRGVDYQADVHAELVVVLGGNMGVGDVDEHPFLKDELAVLAERLAADRPMLGICLGAQLIAAAAGAEVFAGKNGLERGIGPVRFTKAASSDPVLKDVPAKTAFAHFHKDTFTAVPQATLLASTDRYTQQAFKLGATYAFQFHPELDKNTWADMVGAEEAVRTPGDRLASGAARALIERLAHHFAAQVRAGVPQHHANAR